jgi:hypothetical protein
MENIQLEDVQLPNCLIPQQTVVQISSSCLWMANADRSRNVWSLNRYRHSANGLSCRVDLANTLTKRVKSALKKRLRLVVNIFKVLFFK